MSFSILMEAFMLFDDGLTYKHELDDSTVTVSPWDVKKHGQLSAIITQPVYTYYNLKSMFDVIATDGTFFPVITEKGDIFMVDRNLRISESFPAYSLYWRSLQGWGPNVYLFAYQPSAGYMACIPSRFPRDSTNHSRTERRYHRRETIPKQ